MSIESDNTFDQVELMCDEAKCQQTLMVEDTTDFKRACDEAKEQGWKIYYKNGEYNHMCPEHSELS